MNIFFLEIGYKSGNKVQGWFSSFEISSSKNAVNWKTYGDWSILNMGLSEIEYVLQLKTKKVK